MPRQASVLRISLVFVVKAVDEIGESPSPYEVFDRLDQAETFTVIQPDQLPPGAQSYADDSFPAMLASFATREPPMRTPEGWFILSATGTMRHCTFDSKLTLRSFAIIHLKLSGSLMEEWKAKSRAASADESLAESAELTGVGQSWRRSISAKQAKRRQVSDRLLLLIKHRHLLDQNQRLKTETARLTGKIARLEDEKVNLIDEKAEVEEKLDKTTKELTRARRIASACVAKTMSLMAAASSGNGELLALCRELVEEDGDTEPALSTN